ncbi:ATP-dependent Clp protease proteolytic subunit [Verminephrobacter eiseniae]|uniref:ATP-dependent Clp protease proteolytic subunit n=1 Tax=Verminephrobacter eiseniae TaxID=364317 RepID=UPI002238EF82|nr:ATP-dependent Clp protease proteolytic subunit [Verminephrobacter eiseniae]MCW5235972.1 ATP-dependent Clp protease proteolytic subunit [Verminephrobacter eiseniae]
MNDEQKESTEPPGVMSAKLMEYAIDARKVFIIGTIDHKMAKEAVQQLHILASINDDPIYVFISSPGGHVESGDPIFDAIRFITPKVIVVGSGWVASAGALIYVAADKENRYSLPNTRFLLRIKEIIPAEEMTYTETADDKAARERIEQFAPNVARKPPMPRRKAFDDDRTIDESLSNVMRARLNRIFAEATGQTLEKITTDTEHDFWMSAEQAVEYGLVHKIIVSEKEIRSQKNKCSNGP